jgi:hypothetical protein
MSVCGEGANDVRIAAHSQQPIGGKPSSTFPDKLDEDGLDEGAVVCGVRIG